MNETNQNNPDVDAKSDSTDVGTTGPSSPRTNLWQMPTILACLLMIGGGLYFASQRVPSHDFPAALQQVEELVEASQFAGASAILDVNIRPHLDAATPAVRGWFHALEADVLSLGTAYDGGDLHAVAPDVAREYREAADAGFLLSPAQVERWAMASIRLGDFNAARQRLTTLEAMSVDDAIAADARGARNRVMRELVKHSLRSVGDENRTAMEVLDAYISTPGISIEDEIWAIARQAELRMQQGDVRTAIDRLQIAMRRIESRAGDAVVAFGELYTLLGQAYLELSEFSFALEQVNRALRLLDPADARSAAAHVVRGRILLAQRRFEESFSAFSAVVDDYPATDAYAAGLLERAYVQGILGHHEASMQDFISLAELMAEESDTSHVTPARVLDRLIARHDASLASADFEIALGYISLSERFYRPEALPEPALYRLATTHELIGKAILQDAGYDLDDPSRPYASIDPSIRDNAGSFFKKAGDYFAMHATSVQANVADSRDWIASQLHAAEAYDLAGYYDLAIQYFRTYIGGQGPDDPQRLEAQYQLAQCHRAILNHGRAAELFESIIAANPASSTAERSHVPLAQSYIALGQSAQAEQQLLRVVQGREPLGPEATDYRDALFELGTLYHNEGEYTRAIEEFGKWVEYYPDDDAIGEALFRLADSYRRNAEAIEANLAAESTPRSIEDQERSLRASHLDEAIMLYTQVIEHYEGNVVGHLDPMQRDYLRYAYLYRADSAFELGRFDRAIQLYDEAARRYADHPSSLVALIQIVNAYSAQGDRERALTAHNRVLVRLQQMPEEVLDSPDSILDDEAWRQWLAELPPGLGVTQGTSN